MKRKMMLMMAACGLVLSVGPVTAITLDSVVPAQVTVGQGADLVASGSGLAGTTQLLVELALTKVNTDIAKAAPLGTVYGVSAVGDVAYVAGGGKGLQIVDGQDLSSPQLLGSYNTSGYALGVSVVGSLAYVADGGDGLQIVDVTDPSQAQFVGALDTPGYAVGVAVAGNLAVVADLTSLQLIDVTDPAHPKPKGALAMSGPVGRVAVAGDSAYVATGGSEITVISISNPAQPQVTKTIDAFGKAYGVAISGTTLYVADGASGVRAIDITNPSAPLLLDATVDTPGKAADVYVAGGRLYIADLSSLQVADISGDTLATAGEVAMAENLFSVAEVDAQGYVAGSGDSLVVPAPLTIDATAKTETTVSFTLPALTIGGPYQLQATDGTNSVTLANALHLSASILSPQVGWNLLGARTVIPVTQVFDDDTLYASVWKWTATEAATQTWAVYLPGGKDGIGTPDNGVTYAKSKGFLPLTTIQPGEGFWVNSLQAGAPLGLPGALATGGVKVANGWNLVGLTGEQETSVAPFIAAHKESIISLWKWTDSGTGSKTWAVNLPGGKDGGGALDNGASYAQSKGFTLLNTIAPGEGLWINVSTQELSLTLP